MPDSNSCQRGRNTKLENRLIVPDCCNDNKLLRSIYHPVKCRKLLKSNFLTKSQDDFSWAFNFRIASSRNAGLSRPYQLPSHRERRNPFGRTMNKDQRIDGRDSCQNRHVNAAL